MKTADFSYDLPPELIAQEAIEPRDAARLLVARPGLPLLHQRVSDLGEHLRPGDLLVLNRTRVIPARLVARKVSGGAREVLLLHPERLSDPTAPAAAWRALVRGRVADGQQLEVLDHSGLPAARLTISSCHEDGTRSVLFASDLSSGSATDCDVLALAERCGHVPLPPYIARADRPADRERYQTVFADRPGSVAAPTASLHLTTALLEQLTTAGIRTARVELAIGPGTFKPVDTEAVEDFRIHSEWCTCPPETIQAINATRAAGGRVIAVGTTVVRTLETAARQPGGFAPFTGWTRLFLHPPERLLTIDGLVTNFHLPRSSLLMLVACLTGVQPLQALYAEAIRERYRFFSYGDAMLLLPS